MRRTSWLALIWLPVILLAGGCSGGLSTIGAPVALRQVPPPQLEAMLAQAETDLRERRLDTALNGFASVLQAEADNARARSGLAETHLAMGNGELALKAYEGWPGDAAAQPAALQGRGIAQALQGNTAAARQLLTEAVTADPSLWRAWNALGTLHDRQHDWRQADAAYQRALAAHPESAEILNNQGYSFLLRGSHAAAIPFFHKALQRNPKLDAARANLTLANALQGRYEAALASVPAEHLPVALNNVGFAALVRGDYPAAETYLNRALQDSARHFDKANDNLRWLAYLRGPAPAGRPAKLARGPAPAPAPVLAAVSAPDIVPDPAPAPKE